MARAYKTDKWAEPEKLELIGAWARRGLTDEQIAGNMGISRASLYSLRKRRPEVDRVLAENKDHPDIQVENALFESAIKGNTTAQIFWLKNRQPLYWRDRPEQEERESNQASLMDAILEAYDEDQNENDQ